MSLIFFGALGLLLLIAMIQAWPLPTSGSVTISIGGGTGCANPTPSPGASPSAGVSSAAGHGQVVALAAVGRQANPSPSSVPSLPASSASPSGSPSPFASPSPSPNSAAYAPACLFGVIVLPMTPDARLLVIVAVAGALGGTIYALRSFAMFTGNRTLVTSWLPLYISSPVIGAMLGQLLYLVFRAGFLSPAASTTDVSPYGFAAIAALGGLYAGQALEKLKVVFETLLTKVPTQKDPIQATKITDIAPHQASVGSTITITGSGLASVTRVTFTPNVETAPTGKPTDTAVTVLVPPNAQTGHVIVSDPSGTQAVSPGELTVV